MTRDSRTNVVNGQGTVTDTMTPGELLTVEDYGSMDLLDGHKLEWLVCQHLEILQVDHYWLNRHGESNSFPDIYLSMYGSDVSIDCKGSRKYYGSMFIGIDDYDTMAHRREGLGQLWYILNDLSVVEFNEFDEQKERKAGGYRMKPAEPRSISQWLKEIDHEGSRRRRHFVQ